MWYTGITNGDMSDDAPPSPSELPIQAGDTTGNPSGPVRLLPASPRSGQSEPPLGPRSSLTRSSRMRITPIAIAALATSGLGAAAWAQGVGGDSPTLTGHALHRPIQPPEGPRWWVTYPGLEERIRVELDPAGPAWTKVLYPDPITSELIREDRVFIWEHLTIAGDLSWTGWWEHVDAPGFEWVLEDAGPLGNVRAEARVNGIPAPGLNVEVAADWLRFSFERLPREPTSILLLNWLTRAHHRWPIRCSPSSNSLYPSPPLARCWSWVGQCFGFAAEARPVRSSPQCSPRCHGPVRPGQRQGKGGKGDILLFWIWGSINQNVPFLPVLPIATAGLGR